MTPYLSPLSLERLGWTPALADAHDAHANLGRTPARVVGEDRGLYQLLGPDGESRAAVSGRLRFAANGDPAAFPAVGDWVAIESGPHGEPTIQALLPRRTALIRQAAGRRTEAQVVAANIDVVFVVASLKGDLNLRRLERYVALAWESGAEPGVILSKADLASDPTTTLADVRAVAAGTSVLLVSSLDGRGVAAVRERIGSGRTAAFVGSSGVGKSTLLNALAGETRAEVGEVRAGDGRGRHTTVRRQIHVLPGGGLVLDTPGMRELAMWDGDGLEGSFADIEELAAGCRFSDCAHVSEPGCAVRAAIVAGRLSPVRLASMRKLEREAGHQQRRVDALAREQERRRWKNISTAVGSQMTAKYGKDGW
jgi:ribosome biogenesis GTPase / thiamine phosphate phosphatase